MKRNIKLLSVLLILFTSLLFLTGCTKKVESNSEATIDVVEPSDEVTYPNDGRTRLILNTDGLGQVAYYANNQYSLEFDDEYPNQQAITLLENVEEVTIEAKANEGWKFVKWVDKEGKEVSKEIKYIVKIEKDTNNIFRAVFDLE